MKFCCLTRVSCFDYVIGVLLCQNHCNVNKSHGGHWRINQNQSYSELVSIVSSHQWCRLCIEPLFDLIGINRNELFEPLQISDMPPEHWENITLRTSVARFPCFYCMMMREIWRFIFQKEILYFSMASTSYFPNIHPINVLLYITEHHMIIQNTSFSIVFHFLGSNNAAIICVSMLSFLL